MSPLARRARERWLLLALPLVAALVIGVALGVARARSGTGAPARPADAGVAQVGPDTIPRSLLEARMGVASAALRQSGHAVAAGSKEYSALRASVVKSLIFDTLVAQQARARGVAASAEDVSREMAADATAAGGEDKLRARLAEAGGSLEQLRDETTSRLDEANLEDAWAQDRARDALARLGAGRPFEAVAADLSDDEQSRGRGGDMGSVPVAQLSAADAAFGAGLAGVPTGAVSARPIRDGSGYEVVRVDGRAATSISLHRILIAAPRPYTVKERPQWFTEAVLQALLEDCAAGRVRVLVDPIIQPCGTNGPSRPSPRAPAGSPGPPAAGPTPAASPAAGDGFVPRSPPGGASPTAP